MKRFIGRVGLAAVAAAALLAAPSRSMASPQRQRIEKTVAAGGVITIAPQDFTAFDEVKVFIDNSAGGSSRDITVSYYAKDGTTVLYTQVLTVTNGTRKAMIFSGDGGMVPSLPAGVTVVPLSPGYMGFSLAAAGAADGTVGVYAR